MRFCVAALAVATLVFVAARAALRTTTRLFPLLETIFAGGVYGDEKPRRAMTDTAWRGEVVKRSVGAKGLEVLPRRWIVERTIAWINHRR